MRRRIRKATASSKILCLLVGITQAGPDAVGPESLKGHFDPVGLRIEIGESPVLQHDQIIHLIIVTRNRRPQMSADALLIDQFVGVDLLRFDVLEPRIAEFRKIGRAKRRPVNGFERGAVEWIVN